MILISTGNLSTKFTVCWNSNVTLTSFPKTGEDSWDPAEKWAEISSWSTLIPYLDLLICKTNLPFGRFFWWTGTTFYTLLDDPGILHSDYNCAPLSKEILFIRISHFYPHEAIKTKPLEQWKSERIANSKPNPYMLSKAYFPKICQKYLSSHNHCSVKHGCKYLQ